MEWKKLLSDKILGDETNKNYKDVDGRSQFHRDFDRIVFCSAFRRLQDKTQVFPLPENDFVHTRLTHSLEVSCVGRSLGNLIGTRILDHHKELKKEYTNFHFGEIIAAACLAHDIGNPPFGHSGEDAIAEYFKRGNGQQFEKNLDSKCWNDLVKFEGNAQGFRIITKLQNPNIRGGLRLTHATLGAFTKYPKESIVPSKTINKHGKSKLYKKFGFFQSEKEQFTEVADETGLIKKDIKELDWWSRHPLTYLVEASDDICYRIMDLEDGFRLGLLSFKETEELLMPLIYTAKLKGYKDRNDNDKIGYLRAKSISDIVQELANVFADEENNILSDKFENDLISVIPAAKALESIKVISIEKIYSYRSVVEREVEGYEVLGGLLDAFINAANEAAEGKESFKNKNLLKLIPTQFLQNNGRPHDDLYMRLLNITDFVSGMTDSYAVSLFRKIRGISLPGR
ncbi:MAG: deoxyguanosinetriphosphate triphosphohydrolase [Ignavibacteriaceae bacterium]|nr:deoxyguanosinetriphosphate triphosphohydrolase [Ignavibacteriaceae bacterium]